MSPSLPTPLEILPETLTGVPLGWPAEWPWPAPVASLGPGPLAPLPKTPLSRERDALAAGLLLWFGHLEESHAISQEIPSRDGSYWHGLMHRREPDHANAAYWFRRVGPHPIFPELARILGQTHWRHSIVQTQAKKGGGWDPYWMNDACETARNRADADLVRDLEALQWVEYALLLGHCAQGT